MYANESLHIQILTLVYHILVYLKLPIKLRKNVACKDFSSDVLGGVSAAAYSKEPFILELYGSYKPESYKTFTSLVLFQRLWKGA